MTEQSKKDFLLSKLSNFIGFVTAEDKMNIPRNHPYVTQLANFMNNYQGFFESLVLLARFCDSECNISDANISIYFKSIGIDYNTYSLEIKEKLRKYLKCFVTILRV